MSSLPVETLLWERNHIHVFLSPEIALLKEVEKHHIGPLDVAGQKLWAFRHELSSLSFVNQVNEQLMLTFSSCLNSVQCNFSICQTRSPGSGYPSCPKVESREPSWVGGGDEGGGDTRNFGQTHTQMPLVFR